MFYSKSTGGFYVSGIHGDDIPGDAVAITVEYHAELLDGQSNGKMISSDGAGYPFLVDPPSPTDDERQKSAAAYRDHLLAQATIRINPLQDAVDLGMATNEEEALLLLWKRYRVDLNRIDITSHPVNWPQQP